MGVIHGVQNVIICTAVGIAILWGKCVVTVLHCVYLFINNAIGSNKYTKCIKYKSNIKHIKTRETKHTRS